MTDEKTLSLYLKNDENNSFIGVIIALVHVMGYEAIQAEQIATLVHHRGSFTLRQGNYMDLEALKFQLEELNLSVEIR